MEDVFANGSVRQALKMVNLTGVRVLILDTYEHYELEALRNALSVLYRAAVSRIEKAGDLA